MRDFYRALGLDAAQAEQRIRRVRAGGQLHYREAWAMLDALGWIRQEPAAIDVIVDYVNKLDAGEKVSTRERERVAKLVDRLEAQIHALAARVRGDAQAEGTGS